MQAEISRHACQESIRREMLYQMEKILAEKGLSYVDFAVYFADKILPDACTGKKRLVASYSKETGCAG